MTEDKRLKLTYGDFTCEIAGYDEPFEILNKVFGLMAAYADGSPDLMARLSENGAEAAAWRGALAADLAGAAKGEGIEIAPRPGGVAVTPPTVEESPKKDATIPDEAPKLEATGDDAATKANDRRDADEEAAQAERKTAASATDAATGVDAEETKPQEPAEAKKPADADDVIAAFRAANAATAVKAAAVRAAAALSASDKSVSDVEDAVTVSEDEPAPAAEPSGEPAAEKTAGKASPKAEETEDKPAEDARVVDDVEILPPRKGADEPPLSTAGAPDVENADGADKMLDGAPRSGSLFKETLRERDLADAEAARAANRNAAEPGAARDATPNDAPAEEPAEGMKPVASKIVADKAQAPADMAEAATKAADDEPAADKPAADKPAASRPADDKLAADSPEDDKPADEKAAKDGPAGDEHSDKTAKAPAAANSDGGPKLGAEAPMTTTVGAAPPVRRRRRFIVDKERSKPHERPPQPAAPANANAPAAKAPGGLHVSADNFVFDGASETTEEDAAKLAEAEALFKDRYAKAKSGDDQTTAAAAATEQRADAAPAPTPEVDEPAEQGSTAKRADDDEKAAKPKRRGLRLFGSSSDAAAEDPAEEESAPLSASEDPGLDRLREAADAALPQLDRGASRVAGERSTAPIFALSDANDFADDASAGAFARRMGAASLQEALEASAAYVAIVGGKATFSRSDVMQAFSEIGLETPYTKEAQLKTFRKLLANRAIVRTENGAFQLSHATRFGYETRIRAGAA